MANDPAFWTRLIYDVRTASVWRSHAPVVAGGAPRDYILGIPEHDIDIFVPWPNMTEDQKHGMVERLQNRYNWTYVETVEEVRYEGTFEVLNFTVDGSSVQLIILDTTFDVHYGRFDHSLTKITFTAETGLTLDPHFLRSMEYRRVRLLRIDGDGLGARARLEALVARLNAVDPGWTYNL